MLGLTKNPVYKVGGNTKTGGETDVWKPFATAPAVLTIPAPFRLKSVTKKGGENTYGKRATLYRNMVPNRTSGNSFELPATLKKFKWGPRKGYQRQTKKERAGVVARPPDVLNGMKHVAQIVWGCLTHRTSKALQSNDNKTKRKTKKKNPKQPTQQTPNNA